MSLKIGIIGLPNVGKSTLFKALTKQQVEIANYPFATIDPNVGIVEVPDKRVDQLAALSHSKKIIHAAVEFVDIAGLVKGAAEGAGLGNKFLSTIKNVDAIAEVARVFDDNNIIRTEGSTNALDDTEVIEYELILKDLDAVINRLNAAEKELRSGKKGAEEEQAFLQRIKTALDSGRLVRKEILAELAARPELEKIASELELLTAKPIIYVFNCSEEQMQNHWQPDGALRARIGDAAYAIISAKIEAELADLSDEESKEFLNSLGLEESGLHQLIRVGYQTLGLITFLTTGEDETRAWTIPVGSTAPRAGRAIHSDFEEKFIRAEVINWQKLLEAGSFARARELGLVKTEGKEYVVKDGDVIEFKI